MRPTQRRERIRDLAGGGGAEDAGGGDGVGGGHLSEGIGGRATAIVCERGGSIRIRLRREGKGAAGLRGKRGFESGEWW